MKKLEIEKTKPTFIISVLKVDMIKVGLVFSISNFFITKTSLANNWRRKKIPSSSNSALGPTCQVLYWKHIQCSLYICMKKGVFTASSIHHFYISLQLWRGFRQVCLYMHEFQKPDSVEWKIVSLHMCAFCQNIFLWQIISSCYLWIND